MEPKVSVLMPVHNAEAYLSEAVESVLRQSFGSFELICMDDGSTDRSYELLQHYAAQDSRVRVFRKEHAGLIAALNEGLRLCRTPLVARMDADDIATPERLERQYRRFELDSELWVLGTAEERIDAAGRPRGCPPVITGCDEVVRALREKCVIRHPTVMMRREPILAIGGYRAAYKHAEDYDLWLRVSERGKIDNLDFIGLKYRIHPGSVSERYTARQRISAELARATHEIRLAGQSDPTAGLSKEPDLWTDPLLDNLIPEHVRFFRFVDLAFRAESNAFDEQLVWRLMKDQNKSVVRANKRMWQEALTHIAWVRKDWDRLRVASFLAAVQANPGRFLRMSLSYLAQWRSSRQLRHSKI